MNEKALWKKLQQGKEYREAFVAAYVRCSIPHQARALMKAKGLNQTELAGRSGLSQGVVQRALNPNSDSLTLTTIIKIAAGYDVAFLGRFVPFSELAKWCEDLPSQAGDVRSFNEEDEARRL